MRPMPRPIEPDAPSVESDAPSVESDAPSVAPSVESVAPSVEAPSVASSKSSVIELPDFEGGTTPYDLSLEGGGHGRVKPPQHKDMFEIDVFM